MIFISLFIHNLCTSYLYIHIAYTMLCISNQIVFNWPYPFRAYNIFNIYILISFQAHFILFDVRFYSSPFCVYSFVVVVVFIYFITPMFVTVANSCCPYNIDHGPWIQWTTRATHTNMISITMMIMIFLFWPKSILHFGSVLSICMYTVRKTRDSMWHGRRNVITYIHTHATDILLISQCIFICLVRILWHNIGAKWMTIEPISICRYD